MGSEKKMTVTCFRRRKQEGKKIVALTAYDAVTGRLAHACGIDLILVGDSLGNTVLGYENTLRVTLAESLHHSAAVRRGAPNAFIVGDMPFMSYQANPDEALKNAARYIQEAGMDAVKLEGGAQWASLIRRMVGAGIPVMGHIGLLPQQVLTSGGYRIAGKTEEDVERLTADALALQEAGVFSIVLEGVPAAVGAKITAAVAVPTIGIGAGVGCDGQIQVVNDLLGLFTAFVPKHARQYADLATTIETAFRAYADDVRAGRFPGPENSF